jgi:hypothetical protein
MSIDGYLDRAQAALSTLGHIARFYSSEDANEPPSDFGFGLSVILGYIEDEITEAYNECTKPKEKAE